MRRSKFAATLVAVSLAACFGLGVVFHKYGGQALRYYLNVSGVDFIKSPWAVLRVNARGSDVFETLQYTRDHGGLNFRRYVETGLLPLSSTESGFRIFTQFQKSVEQSHWSVHRSSSWIDLAAYTVTT
jgi:hypothetical protein